MAYPYHEISLANPCLICGVQNYTGTGLSPITLVFPYQYYSTIALYSFIHLSLTESQQLVVVLNNVGLSPPASDVHYSQTLSQDTAVGSGVK